VKHIEIVEDASVGLGGCRVLTRHGEIDAQIEHQLDRVIGDVTNGMDEKSNAPS
jgi:flagellar biosynthesis/type III secretory pathway protein FliH